MHSLSDSHNSFFEPKDDSEVSALDLLGVISENLRLLIIGPVLAGLIGFGFSFLMTPMFTAKTNITPPGQSSASGAAALLGQLGGLGSLVVGGGHSANQYIAFLESNTLLNEMVEPFKLMEYYKVKHPYQAAAALKGATKISSDKKSGFIIIEVSDSDPEFAAKMANAYVGALSQMLGKMAINDARFRQNFLEQQINMAIDKSYRSPAVREAIILSVVKDYETALLDQKKDSPYIQQVDVAEVPKFRSSPKRKLITLISALVAGGVLLLFVFIRNTIRIARHDPEKNIQIQEILRNLQKQLFFKK